MKKVKPGYCVRYKNRSAVLDGQLGIVVEAFQTEIPGEYSIVAIGVLGRFYLYRNEYDVVAECD